MSNSPRMHVVYGDRRVFIWTCAVYAPNTYLFIFYYLFIFFPYAFSTLFFCVRPCRDITTRLLFLPGVSVSFSPSRRRPVLKSRRAYTRHVRLHCAGHALSVRRKKRLGLIFLNKKKSDIGKTIVRDKNNSSRISYKTTPDECSLRPFATTRIQSENRFQFFFKQLMAPVVDIQIAGERQIQCRRGVKWRYPWKNIKKDSMQTVTSKRARLNINLGMERTTTLSRSLSKTVTCVVFSQRVFFLLDLLKYKILLEHFYMIINTKTEFILDENLQFTWIIGSKLLRACFEEHPR